MVGILSQSSPNPPDRIYAYETGYGDLCFIGLTERSDRREHEENRHDLYRTEKYYRDLRMRRVYWSARQAYDQINYFIHA